MKKPKCLQCGSPVQCRCISLDIDHPEKGGIYYFCSQNCYHISNEEDGWDSEIGDFNGHFADCEHGGHFKEKWSIMKAERDRNWKLYAEYHEKHKQLKKNIEPLFKAGDKDV